MDELSSRMGTPLVKTAHALFNTSPKEFQSWTNHYCQLSNNSIGPDHTQVLGIFIMASGTGYVGMILPNSQH